MWLIWRRSYGYKVDMESSVMAAQSSSDQLPTVQAPRRKAGPETRSAHLPASLTSAALPGLLTGASSSNFMAEDPSPFPSGCAQPSSPPLIQPPYSSPPKDADAPEAGNPLRPAFVGSVYTMGDRARKQMVSLGRVQKLPPGPPLPGFLRMVNESPVGRVVEKGILWWLNRGRERPRFEFFLNKESAGKRVDVTKAGWLLSPEVTSGTVVECPLQAAYNFTKIDSDVFKLVPDKKQVRAAKRILRRQFGRRAADSFRGTPVFAANNFNIVVPTVEGVRWYTPCFLDKSQLHSALDRSVDLHFEGLIRARRAQRYSSLDPGGPSPGLGAPPSDGDGLEEDSSLLDPSEMKDLMEEAPSGHSVGVDKILFNLAAVYAQDFFDDVVLGNKWGRRAVGLQPHFSITVDSFEDCAAAAEAAAIARERLQKELTRRIKELESLGTPPERGGIQWWGPDAFKDSGPPGSSLLGDVARRVDAKQGGVLDESEVRVGSEVDGRFHDQAGDADGRTPNKPGGDVSAKKVGLGETSSGLAEEGSAPEGRNGAGDQPSAPSADGVAGARASEKKWWEVVMERSAAEQAAREAPLGSPPQQDGVVVNRGPGWEIVRRGPFWNRQYELKQVGEDRPGAGPSGEPSESQERGGTDAEVGHVAGSDWLKRGQQKLREEIFARASRKERKSGDGSPTNPALGGTEESSEVATASQSGSDLEGASRRGADSEGPVREKEGRTGGVTEQHGITLGAGRPSGGRFISQQEWDVIKMVIEAKLKGSAGAGATGDARQQKWEALKASVEAKLALKYQEREAGKKAAGEASTSFEGTIDEGQGLFDKGGISPPGRSVSSEAERLIKGRGDVRGGLRKGVDGKREREKVLRRRARHVAVEAAAEELAAAAVLRNEARMALIAVAAGSPQEKDLQGALDAVTRDIHAKSATGSETSMMFIANVGSLFAPVGRQVGGPK